MKKKKRSRKKKKHQKDMEEFLPDLDEIFAFIAGYTSGGAAFGITWEELGLRPFASRKRSIKHMSVMIMENLTRDIVF